MKRNIWKMWQVEEVFYWEVIKHKDQNHDVYSGTWDLGFGT